MAGKCALIGKKCPEKATGDYFCPNWLEGIVERNDATGEERVTQGCQLRLIPRWMTQSTHAIAIAAGEVSAMRTNVVKAIERRPRQIAIEVGNGAP